MDVNFAAQGASTAEAVICEAAAEAASAPSVIGGVVKRSRAVKDTWYRPNSAGTRAEVGFPGNNLGSAPFSANRSVKGNTCQVGIAFEEK